MLLASVKLVGGAVLELPRPEALEWLGLRRPELGAIEVSELIPRCRRRWLWPEARNMGPLREHVRALTAALSAADPSSAAVLHFG